MAMVSGVTEQLGALNNLAMQGPLRRQIDQQKFAKFPASKQCFYRQNQNRRLWKFFMKARLYRKILGMVAESEMLAKRATFGECRENFLNYAL